VTAHLLFQYCPKIAVFDGANVLLCRRAGEADLDGTFTFIGGKMEHRDTTIVNGLRREKTEEIGADTHLSVLRHYSINVEFTKADGNRMILPHYLADWQGGIIKLSDEYSEHRWVPVDQITDLPNVVPNAADICRHLDRLRSIATPEDFVTI
jgi:ADP-ribose pyrophosphatase YjhB (NUDIX family)